MTPVTQRVFAAKARGDGHNGLGIAGDCFRAALASILEMPYDQVPHVVHYGDGRPAQDTESDDPLTEEHGGLWWRRLRRWLRAEFDLDAGCWQWDDPDYNCPELLMSDGEPWSGYVILGGRSPRGDFAHVVVGYYSWRDGEPHVEVAHDPHPSRDGLRNVEDVTALIPPYDPPPPDEDAA